MKSSAILTGALFALLMCAACTSTAVSSKTPQWKVSPSNPAYYINSVAVNSDGSRVVGGTFFHNYSSTSDAPSATTTDPSSGTFGTYCYNQNGSLLWKDEFNGWQGTYWVDISTNGAFAASGGWYSNSPYAGFVRAYDASNGNKLLDVRTTNRVNQVQLSADGTWLVSAAETLMLFQRGAGNAYSQTATFNPGIAKDSIQTAAISADGSRVVCGDYNGNIYVFSNSAGTLTQIAKWQQSSYSHSIRITPDGTSFVAGGPSGYVYFFVIADLIKTGKPTASYQISSKSSVYGVAVSDDGSAFAGVSNLKAGSTDGGLVCFIQRSGSQAKLLWQYKTARNPNCISLNLAKGIVAVADGHPDATPGNFYLLNAANGNLLWQYGTSNMSWPIMISQSGNAIAAGSDDSNIYYFTP